MQRPPRSPATASLADEVAPAQRRGRGRARGVRRPARAPWPPGRAAPLVLVGADLAASWPPLAPGRRDGCPRRRRAAPGDGVFRAALALGAEHGGRRCPRCEAWLVELLADVGERARAAGASVGVVGGAGGAGRRRFACALGQVGARRGRRPWSSTPTRSGPGLDRLLGLEQRRRRAVGRARRDRRPARRAGRCARRVPAARRPRRAHLVRAGAGRSTGVRASARRCRGRARGHDLVVVDLPAHAPPGLVELVARCDRLLVVVACRRVAGLAAAARLVAGCAGPRRAGLVRARRRASTRDDVERVDRAAGRGRRARPARARRVGRPRPRPAAPRRGSAGPGRPRACWADAA